MTEQNSNEMKTVVETFIIEETSELIYDGEKLSEWNELVKVLGLGGQENIVQDDKSPIPFLHIKKSMVNVFETLCPRKVAVDSYRTSPIPLEILRLVALSRREKYFSKIEVWYDDKAPDPVVVGYGPYIVIENGNGNSQPQYGYFLTKDDAVKFIDDNNLDGHKPYGYEWNAEKYLIGKWADVKHSFKELKQMATDRYIETEGHALRKTIKDSQRQLDDLEQLAFERFN